MLSAIDLFCGAGVSQRGSDQTGVSVLGAGISLTLQSRHTRRITHIHVYGGVIYAGLNQCKSCELDLRPGDSTCSRDARPAKGFRHYARTIEAATLTTVATGWSRNLRASAKHLNSRSADGERARTGSGSTLQSSRDTVGTIGLPAHYGVLDAADYGVPQRRRRFVLLGLLDEQVDFPSPMASLVRVRDAIGRPEPPDVSDDPLHNHGEADRTRSSN